MKLLYLMTEPLGLGGVQSDMLALSGGLIPKGHQVHVATETGCLQTELQATGAHLIPVAFHFNGWRSFWRAVKTLQKIIKEYQIDMLAPQSVRTTLISYFALRWGFDYKVAKTGKALPIITTIHNIHNPRHFSYVGLLLNLCSDYVIFESHYERNRLLNSGLSAKKSEVIHSGIDTDQFSPKPAKKLLYHRYQLDPNQHKIFGIVARLSEEKGHDYLLYAFEQLYAHDRDVRLLIIGDGPLLNRLRSLRQSLGLARVVHFCGSQRNIADYLALLHVFVLSSTRESFPLAAREAMAAGKAVIAPNIGGCPEVVSDGETGLLFAAANAADLCQKMTQILHDKRYLTYGVAARKKVETLFSRQQWIERDEAVYLRYF
jgi:glycosyltransferase involved in cell wall biosynthesis